MSGLFAFKRVLTCDMAFVYTCDMLKLFLVAPIVRCPRAVETQPYHAMVTLACDVTADPPVTDITWSWSLVDGSR